MKDVCGTLLYMILSNMINNPIYVLYISVRLLAVISYLFFFCYLFSDIIESRFVETLVAEHSNGD